MAEASLAYTGLTFLPAAFFGFLVWSDLNSLITDSESKKRMLEFLDTTAGSVWLSLAALDARKLLEDGYSPGDIYNPFKHIKNLISGSLYLAENHQRLVSLDK